MQMYYIDAQSSEDTVARQIGSASRTPLDTMVGACNGDRS